MYRAGVRMTFTPTPKVEGYNAAPLSLKVVPLSTVQA